MRKILLSAAVVATLVFPVLPLLTTLLLFSPCGGPAFHLPPSKQAPGPTWLGLWAEVGCEQRW